MKKLFILLVAMSFLAFLADINRLPGPVKILRGTNYITLDVTDTTMVDMNNRVKLMQKGDTLVILSDEQEIGRISVDEVWWAAPGTINALSEVDTIQFTEGNVYVTANTGAPDDQIIFNVDGISSAIYNHTNKNIFTIHGISLSNGETAPPIAIEGLLYYNTTLNKILLYNGTSWDTLSGGGGTGDGTITGTISAGKIPVGTGTDEIGEDADFTYNTTTGQMYVESAYYTKNARSYINPAVTNNAGNIANLLGTEVAFTSNAKMAQVNSLATARWYVKNDSTVTENYTVAKDSIYAKYIPTSNKTRWWAASHTKAFYVDSSSNSGFMIKWKERPSLKESMDTLNGEWKWYTFDENGIHEWKGIEDIPRLGLQLQSLMAGIEYNRLELYDRDMRIEKLENEIEELRELIDRPAKINAWWIAISLAVIGVLLFIVGFYAFKIGRNFSGIKGKKFNK